MSKINDKLGLKPAGKRAMMNLPSNRSEAAVITATQCPKCGARGVRASAMKDAKFWCTWCNHRWSPEP